VSAILPVQDNQRTFNCTAFVAVAFSLKKSQPLVGSAFS